MAQSLEQLNILCTICARGGSKGVPGKNSRPLQGRPLIAHSIEQAKATGIFSHIAVSSDDKEILNAAETHGADILVERPPELATDQAAKLPVIQHCFNEAEKRTGKTFDIDVDLDVTSPLRWPEDITGCVQMLLDKNAHAVISGMNSRRSPYFNLVEEQADGSVQLAKTLDKQVVRRQDVPKTYDLNSSIYVWTRDSLLSATQVIRDKTFIFEMPEDRSVDIDNPFDWELVEFMLTRKAQL